MTLVAELDPAAQQADGLQQTLSRAYGGNTVVRWFDEVAPPGVDIAAELWGMADSPQQIYIPITVIITSNCFSNQKKPRIPALPREALWEDHAVEYGSRIRAQTEAGTWT
jgi:hypothetical protein